MQPSILRAFGWRFALVLTKDWYHTPHDVLARLEKALLGQEVEPEAEEPIEEPAPVVQAASVIASTVAPTPATVAPAPVELPRIEPAPAVVSGSAPSSVRHFEFIGGPSRKFWEISVSGNSFTVRFGRIGTPGQSQTKTFADEAKAKREAQNMVAEKLKKGYVEQRA